MKRSVVLACLAAACATLFSGCVAFDLAHDLPGDNPSLIAPGVDRATVEQALGKAIRVWRPNDEISYGLYAFADPQKGSTSDALGIATMDLITLGMVEGLSYATNKEDPQAAWRPRLRHLIWIGFDRQGRVCAHYREFAVLPERPPPPSH